MEGGTVQRKILPFDILNLADMSSVESRLTNAAGRKLSSVKICASLIDKPPNLGGLARTCEIFGVGSLIMGDKRIAVMDNFKSTSVSAERWVNIEECREKVRGARRVVGGWGGGGGVGGKRGMDEKHYSDDYNYILTKICNDVRGRTCTNVIL